MSSLAQEENRRISENVTWGHRKRFADGKVCVPYRHFLGYDKGPDGKDGYIFHSIARELTARGLETPAKKKRWYPRTVESILTNEKYKGDALLQKRFTVNFLTKETKANEGEVPQYYVENNHEAIISPQVFDWVQEEIKRRREGRGRYSGVSIFSSKIKCGQCGGWYGAKVWHSTDKYRRTIYRCNDKFKSHCKTPHLTEDDIKEAFVRAVNQLIENKADVLDSITLLKERLTDTEDLEEERDRISTDLNLLADKIQQLIAENARVAQNQDDYDRNYNELVSRYEAAKTQYDKTCQAFCLVIEKGAVDYCVLSISLKPGSKNTASATMIMPIPQMTNHFSTPSRSARGPEMTRPNGMAREAALVSREKTLPRYSGLTVS